MYILILLITTLRIEGIQTSTTSTPEFSNKQACEIAIAESQQLATNYKAYGYVVETKVSAVCVANHTR